MYKFILIFSFALLIAACGEKKVVDVNSIEITNTTLKAKAGADKMVAEIKIQGMMCQNACVSKVNKELAEMSCVKNVEMDFDVDREVDIAKVEFDHDQCDAKKMIEKIHSIGDGMYEVKAVNVIEYK